MTTIFNILIAGLLHFLILTNNILFGVLSLIAVALLFSFFIIGNAAVFIGLLYLAIYVGAVTVFILFVVMMTDLSIVESSKNRTVSPFLESTVIAVSYALSFAFVSLFEFCIRLTPFDSGWSQSFVFANLLSQPETMTFILSHTLFTKHLAPFIAMGVLILISLIGSIFVISQAQEFDKRTQDTTRSQDMDEQLLAESKNSIKLNHAKTIYTAPFLH
jgi:NADH-quinone oxidoreductase subunit J